MCDTGSSCAERLLQLRQPQVAASLPAVGRILLQTGAHDTARFQQAVAAALAHQLGASLLVGVNNETLPTTKQLAAHIVCPAVYIVMWDAQLGCNMRSLD